MMILKENILTKEDLILLEDENMLERTRREN